MREVALTATIGRNSVVGRWEEFRPQRAAGEK
jgi:hypothetical protein